MCACSVKLFADTLIEHIGPAKLMNVYVADRFYENVYNKTVLPMKVIVITPDDTLTIGFNRLLEIFGKVPYLVTSKSCVRRFTVLSIVCDEVKEYHGHSYYATAIRLVNSSEVIEACKRLRDKVDERIREFRQEISLDLSDFVEL